MKNQLKLLLATVVVITFIVTMVSALSMSTVIQAPGNNTNHTGSVTYNCTTAALVVLNITIDANSSSGTMTQLGTASNTSVNQTTWEGSVTITSTNDGTGYNISCFADNGTAQAYSAEIGSTGVTLDTTSPLCNITKQHSTFAYKGNQKIIYYSSDAQTRRLTTVDVDGPGNQETITVTAQNGPIDLASNDTKYTGSWTANMTVTDWSGNTACTASTTFKTYLPDGDGEIPSDRDTGKDLFLLLIVGLVLWYAFKK